MTNLIFDLNNIAFRSLYIVGGYGDKQFTFDSQDEIDQLVRKIAMDVSYITRLINPQRIIFAIDSKSWRKQIKIEENDGYKSGRKRSSVVNWNNVFNALHDFGDVMEKQGMITTRIETAEADDILAMWVYELLNIQQQHVICVSGDEDIRQLVRFMPTDENMTSGDRKIVFSTVYNPFLQGKNASKKLYVCKHFEKWINKTAVADIFNMKGSIDVDKEDFKKIITAEKTKMEVIDGRMIALKKVFCGDDGDDVPAFYTWIMKDDAGNVLLDKKTGEPRTARITNSKFIKIYNALIISPNELMDHHDLWDRKDQIMEEIKKIAKHDPPFKIKDRLRRQIQLVVLDTFDFPETIQDDFEKAKEIALQKPKVNYSSLNMHDLLKGTQYITEKKKSSEASIFRQIDHANQHGKSLF